MGVPVYKRILDLFEAEGSTQFGIPDPNSCTCSPRPKRADGRWWRRTTSERRVHGRGGSRMTGKPGVCIGTLGPGVANIAGAMMCAKVENSPVIFLGGQRARITERASAAAGSSS